jgi:hypothetical protein
MQDGSIYLWKGISVIKSLDPAHAGPIFDFAIAGNSLLRHAPSTRLLLSNASAAQRRRHAPLSFSLMPQQLREGGMRLEKEACA